MKNYEEIKCKVKYNYSIIVVRMPEEMRAALQKCFTPSHYKMKRRSFRKKLGMFRKNYWFIIFYFGDYGPFKDRPGANISNTFLPNTTLLESSGCSLKLKNLHYIKFNKVDFGDLNVRDHLLIGIRCEKDNIIN